MNDHPWTQNGGPAFPVEGEVTSFKGMTLRDWFAGQAISGALAQDAEFESADWSNCAKYAYELADAMLAEREKSK